jgi:hypothetical protein
MYLRRQFSMTVMELENENNPKPLGTTSANPSSHAAPTAFRHEQATSSFAAHQRMEPAGHSSARQQKRPRTDTYPGWDTIRTPTPANTATPPKSIPNLAQSAANRNRSEARESVHTPFLPIKGIRQLAAPRTDGRGVLPS